MFCQFNFVVSVLQHVTCLSWIALIAWFRYLHSNHI